MLKNAKFEDLPELPFSVDEAFNQLRINLDFAAPDTKVIMVNSGEPNEGKSFIALNLMLKLAESGSRVLLIDADLRNSHLITKYHLVSDEKIRGIEYYLSGKSEIDEVIYSLPNKGAYIAPVTRNMNYPIGLLEGKRFAEMIQIARNEFDYVLVDSPPVITVPDALKIVLHCDGTLLVMKSKTTSRIKAKETLELLKRTGKPLIGIILNAHSGGYNKYYGKKYGGHYGGYYGKKSKA